MEKMSPQDLGEAAKSSKAWPFEEARKLVERLKRFERKEVVFETGYGPSGLRTSARSARSPVRAWSDTPFAS